MSFSPRQTSRLTSFSPVLTRGGQVFAVPRRFLDARRPYDTPSKADQEEQLLAYDPVLPADSRWLLSRGFEVSLSPSALPGSSLIFSPLADSWAQACRHYSRPSRIRIDRCRIRPGSLCGPHLSLSFVRRAQPDLQQGATRDNHQWSRVRTLYDACDGKSARSRNSLVSDDGRAQVQRRQLRQKWYSE